MSINKTKRTRNDKAKAFHTQPYINNHYRPIFLKVLANEYPQKINALESVLPLFLEVMRSDQWRDTSLGSVDPTALTNDPNILVIPENAPSKYSELLEALRAWTKDLGCNERYWMVETAVYLLRLLCVDEYLKFHKGEPPVEWYTVNLRPKPHSGVSPLIHWINLEAVVEPSEGVPYIAAMMYQPQPPQFPPYNFFESEEMNRQKQVVLQERYISDSKNYFKEFGMEELPEKRKIETHCLWLSWKCVEGMSLRDIAHRTSERGMRESVSESDVTRGIKGLSKLLDRSVCIT
ncbi:MAG: hypothetical protein ACRCYY_00370 [Trueperaceae bacterium]